ncbi:MAG: hypothetical protein QHH18_07880 [Candidatus Bathyarchaeota archaeon]|nr:hypothetical protein [Candidatus Bathyarchaeota archaeon]
MNFANHAEEYYLEAPNLKTWKTAVLLSIIVVPVGLFVAFKLTERTSEAQTVAETVTLEPVRWEFERPSFSTKVTENDTNENITALYFSNDFLANPTITIYSYCSESEFEFGSSCFRMVVSSMVSVQGGYIVYVNVSFQEDYTASRVGLFKEPDLATHLYNLSTVESVDGLVGAQKAYFSLMGVNNPQYASFRKPTVWLLRSLYNQSHLLRINVEFTYFNGTVYKRVIQPFVLKVFPDDNNSFETAEELSVNQTRRAYVGCPIDPFDRVDYYKVWLEEGTTVILNLNYLGGGGIETYVYGPNGTLEACLLNRGNSSLKQLMLKINKTGWRYIKLAAPDGGHFIYTVTVITQSDEA